MEILFPFIVLFLAAIVENSGCPCGDNPPGICTCQGQCKCRRCNAAPIQNESMGLLPPATSTSARMGQSFQAALLSQPGSMSNRFAINSGAHDAYTLRMQGKDPGEQGFALIRASRGGSLGQGWGQSWPYDRLEADTESTTDSIADQVATSFGKIPSKKSKSDDVTWVIPSETDELVKSVFSDAILQMKRFGVEKDKINVWGDGESLRISTPVAHINTVKTSLKVAGMGKDIKLIESWLPDRPEIWSIWIGRTSSKPTPPITADSESYGRMGHGGGRHGGGMPRGGAPRAPRGSYPPRGGHRPGPVHRGHPAGHWRGGPWGWGWWPYGPLYSTPVIIDDAPMESAAAANAFAAWAQGETEEKVDVDEDGTVRASFDGKGSFQRWRKRMASMASQMAGRYSAVPELKSTVMGFAVRFLAR